MAKRLNFHAGKSNKDGMPTKHIGVGGTDLGFLFEGGKQFAPKDRSSLWVGGLFGDTFNDYNGSPNWRSPVMMRSSNTDFGINGIKWDNAVRGGGQIIDYPHIPGGSDPRRQDKGCFSLIPNDAIQLPDGHYMAMGVRVKDWNSGPGQQMAHTHSSVWLHSTEPHAETWEWAYDIELGNGSERGLGYQWWNKDRDQFFQNTTFLQPPGSDYVYVFGTPEGRYSGTDKAGIYLRRCHWKHLWERSKWEFWGWQDNRWQWGKDVWPSRIIRPLVHGTSIGEISAQWLGGKVRLTYCDGPLGAVCRTAEAPDAPWALPRTILPASVTAPGMMYAPSLHPWNTVMESAAFNIAAWPHHGDFHEAYGSYTYTANIEPPELPKPLDELARKVCETGISVPDDRVVRALVEAAG